MFEKKKHHSFRIGLTAPEVMRRLEAYTNRRKNNSIQIHTVDIHGYDLTLKLGFDHIRVSFREDAQSEDTIVFLEDNGRNASVANDVEYILNERKYLRKPLYRSQLYRWMAALFGISVHDINIDVAPELVLESVYQFKHPTGQLIFSDNEISGIYDIKYYVEPSKLNPDIETTLYLHQGTSSDHTRLLYEVTPSTCLPCHFFFIILVSPLIISGLVTLFSGSVPFHQVIVPTAIFTAFAFWSARTIRHTRKVHREFDKWLNNNLHTSFEKAKNDDLAEIDRMPDEQSMKRLSGK